MFGDPQSRDRLYMPSIRERLLQALQVDGDEFFDKVSEILRIFIGFPITPLNSVLLSDQDSYIRTLIWSWIGQNPTDFRFECVQVRNMINETEPKDLPKWLQMVLTGCQKLHVSIDKFLQPPSQDFMTMFPYVRTLTLRGWIILQMNAPSLPAMGMPSVIDLSQNFELQTPKDSVCDNDNDSQPRAVGGGGVCGCFTPSGIKVHTGKVRPICGLEGFRLQNIYFLGDDADEKLREFSDDLLHDLAGNAMHCGCSTAMTLAVFTAIAWFSLQREKRESRSKSDATATDAKSKYRRRTLSDSHFKAKVAALSIADALGGGSSGGSADGAGAGADSSCS